MPILSNPISASSLSELKAHFPDFQQDPNNLKAHIPHRVYHIDAEDLLAGKGLSAARLIGWRYILKQPDGDYQVAEVGEDKATGRHTFHYLNSGRHVDHFLKLYEDIHLHGSVQEKDYEIHLLLAPACYLMAVWLKGANHEHEFMIPLSPAHSNFEVDKKYEVQEFEAQLAATAAQTTGYRNLQETINPSKADELTKIEGIGPSIASLLISNGIESFVELARTTATDIEKMMAEAGPQFNLHDATTWPEQAALGLAGKWKELDQLQDILKGGRRMS